LAGNDGEITHNSLEIYDVAKDQWSEGPSLREGKIAMTMVVIQKVHNSLLFSFGGYTMKPQQIFEIERLDLGILKEWEYISLNCI
jgi:hypothetical protein